MVIYMATWQNVYDILLVRIFAMLVKILSYIPAIIGLCLVGLLTLLNNPKSYINRVFFYLNISVSAWLFCLFIADVSASNIVALIATRFAIFWGNIFPLFFLYFSMLFPFRSRINTKKAILIAIPSVVFSLLALTPLIIPQIEIKSFGAQPINLGIGYILTEIYVVVYLLSGFFILYRKGKKSRAAQRNQIRLVITGTIIAMLVNIVTNIVLTIFQVQTNAILLGSASLFIFSLFVAYAIIKHKLFDIRAVVARSLTYIFSIGTVATVYGFIAFRIVTLFAENLNQSTQYAIFTILAVILAFTFAPLKRFFERVTDKIFYRDKYDPQTVLNNISHILASEIQLSQLSEDIVKAIKTQMRIAGADIVVVDEKEIFYKTRPIVGPQHEIGVRELGKLAKSIVVADELSGGERKEIMSTYGLSVSLALRTHEQFLGFLLLGEKQSGDIYSEADLRLLRIIADELAIAIQNAKSYAEIQQFNETLQTKIAWATQKLRNANEDLKALDQAKDEFISMASHQLRTPLTTTKGYVSMVLEGDFGKISADQRDPLSQALDSANRMAGLVSDLLNVSRMDAGKFFIDAHELDLAKVVQSEFNGLTSMADSKQIKLKLEPLPKALPLINLDEEKTRQVIMNLIDNAIHYSAPPAGGGDVRVSLKKVGGKLVFTVVDNGIGVPEKIQGKLFTKFYRASNAQTTRPDGTGLGLYLVKRVVEDQGGELIFESKEGKGSTFGFRFPLKTKFKAGATKARVPLSG